MKNGPKSMLGLGDLFLEFGSSKNVSTEDRADPGRRLAFSISKKWIT